jgi:hypothetical protein
MTALPRVFATSIALVLCLLLVPPALAQRDAAHARKPLTAQLAKKCRALAFKAYPPEPIGSKSSNAKAQRAYFEDCVAKNGNMSN